MNIKEVTVRLINVSGHYEDDPNLIYGWTFGVIPDNYTGDEEDLPEDHRVAYWLQHDEPLTVGEVYGDFVVTEIEQ